MESVNDSLNPLKLLILSYAKKEDRRKFEFLFAFDSRLAEVIRSTSEPLIGQMRLTWWRDILTKVADDRPEGEPLVELFNNIEHEGLFVSHLSALLDGWEIMLDDFPWDDRQFENYALNRGVGFFGFASSKPELSDEHIKIAKLWALWDFATHCSDAKMRNEAFARCVNLSKETEQPSFDKNGRPLSILCKLAMRDAKSGRLSETMYRPSTAAHIIWHGITGL
ncbi:MAG: squalene/phytoene synthase family protein [Parasphingorhabdus sp.]